MTCPPTEALRAMLTLQATLGKRAGAPDSYLRRGSGAAKLPAMRALVLLVLILVATAPAGRAATRLALVIGNAAYAEVPALPNPAADARLMAATLGRLGFEVMLVLDAPQDAMKRAIAEFGRKLRALGAEGDGLFYYAGHGVQANGTNYLIPVDAAIGDEADFDLAGVEAGWVLRQMESARSRTSIVILDACRDNPFQLAGARAVPGLARMDAPTGSFVAYSTAPGETAADGTGTNSPFTAALATALSLPGLTVEEVFREVRIEVLRVTNGAQTPWDSSSLTGRFYFASAPEDPAASAERRLWESVAQSDDMVELALFLRAYPGSIYAPEVRRRLASLSGTAEKPAAPVPVAAPAGPGEAEIALIVRAQTSGLRPDYEAYLAAHPAGAFAELAMAEIAAIDAKSGRDPLAARPAEPPPAPLPAPAPEVAPSPATVVAFDAALLAGPPAILGRSLADIITGSPLFPPIEGLPDEVWKGKLCSNCHGWTKAALCDQGLFYTKGGEERLAGQVHPLGRPFIETLKYWAAAGCP
jgi:uncharacterized caspase-like protein